MSEDIGLFFCGRSEVFQIIIHIGDAVYPIQSTIAVSFIMCSIQRMCFKWGGFWVVNI